MLSGIIKIIILVVIILVIAWIGLSIYSCFNRPAIGQPDMPSMPDQNAVAYSVYIKNTGNLILTNDYEVHGSEVCSRVFILHSFWELRGREFKFVEGDIILDEAIFGEITIKRRIE